jgi:hypothetical protein
MGRPRRHTALQTGHGTARHAPAPRPRGIVIAANGAEYG